MTRQHLNAYNSSSREQNERDGHASIIQTVNLFISKSMVVVIYSMVVT